MKSGYESTCSDQPFCTHGWGDSCSMLFQGETKLRAQKHSAFVCLQFMISICMNENCSMACTPCIYVLNHKFSGCCVLTVTLPSLQSAEEPGRAVLNI